MRAFKKDKEKRSLLGEAYSTDKGEGGGSLTLAKTAERDNGQNPSPSNTIRRNVSSSSPSG